MVLFCWNEIITVGVSSRETHLHGAVLTSWLAYVDFTHNVHLNLCWYFSPLAELILWFPVCRLTRGSLMCIPNMMARHLKISFKRGSLADGLLPLASRVSWCVLPPQESHIASTCRRKYWTKGWEISFEISVLYHQVCSHGSLFSPLFPRLCKIFMFT